MATLAIDKLWGFLQSLSLSESNERWLAKRLLESANAKSSNAKPMPEAGVWSNYRISPEIMNMSIPDRKIVSDNIEDSLSEALEEKYR